MYFYVEGLARDEEVVSVAVLSSFITCSSNGSKGRYF